MVLPPSLTPVQLPRTLLKTIIRSHLRLPPIPRTPLVQILLQPPKHQLQQGRIPKQPASLPPARWRGEIKRIDRAILPDGAERHSNQMGRPSREPVHDVRRIHDRAGARHGLCGEEGEEAAARENVQVDGHLVEEQNRPWAEETHG